MSEFEEDGGCRDLLVECQALVREYDPESRGRNTTVNSICSEADECIDRVMTAPYRNTANVSFHYPKYISNVPTKCREAGMTSRTLKQTHFQYRVSFPWSTH